MGHIVTKWVTHMSDQMGAFLLLYRYASSNLRLVSTSLSKVDALLF
jgi:hypothetical protein